MGCHRKLVGHEPPTGAEAVKVVLRSGAPSVRRGQEGACDHRPADARLVASTPRIVSD